MGAMLRLLEKRGLIRRARHSRDGRARAIRLTPHGRHVHKALGQTALPLHRLLEETLGGRREAETVLKVLKSIAERMK
jgi:DNA-binding MarR family transcriptional regulator